jgi:hypothetical protein
MTTAYLALVALAGFAACLLVTYREIWAARRARAASDDAAARMAVVAKELREAVMGQPIRITVVHRLEFGPGLDRIREELRKLREDLDPPEPWER